MIRMNKIFVLLQSNNYENIYCTMCQAMFTGAVAWPWFRAHWKESHDDRLGD